MKIIKALKGKKKSETTKVEAYRDVFEQYLVDASFLWLLRSVGVKQPHYSVADIQEMEQRIDAHLDGLMSSIDLTWDLCLEALALEQPGEVFASAIIAFRTRDVEKIKIAVSCGLFDDDTAKGLVSALAWLSENLVHDWIQKLLTSKDLNHKYLAISACSLRREYPGEVLSSILQREDCVSHKKLYARALRLIGELKLIDFRWALDNAVADDDPSVKFWAIWSIIMLGDRSVASQMHPFVITQSPEQFMAVHTVFRVLPIDEARQWISGLASDPEQVRNVIEATGVLGDPHVVPWLIEKMRNVDTAKKAAEAFSMITGIDLERYELSIDAPEDITVIPNDDEEDDAVGLDEDENLPFPDVDKLAYTWQKHGAKYVVGQRYFMGKAISPEILHDKITHGFQRQRHAAALELALIDAGSPFINTKARS